MSMQTFPTSWRVALEQLGRARLAEITRKSGLTVADGRFAAAHADAIVGAPAEVFAKILRALKRTELLEVCAVLEIETAGLRKDAIVERILLSAKALAESGVDKEVSGVEAASADASPEPTNTEAIESRVPTPLEFPRLDGYVVDLRPLLFCPIGKVKPLVLKPTLAEDAVVVRTADGWVTRDDAGAVTASDGEALTREQFYAAVHLQRTAVEIARDVADGLAGGGRAAGNQSGTPRRIEGARSLLPQIYEIVVEYLTRRVKLPSSEARIEEIALARHRNAITTRLVGAIELEPGEGERVLMPRLDAEQLIGRPAVVHIRTGERWSLAGTTGAASTATSEENSSGSEERELEQSSNVVAYARNEGPRLEIEYEFGGAVQRYSPAFLARLGDGVTWIIDVKAEESEEDRARWQGARKWVVAVNNAGRYGVWKHVPCMNANALRQLLAAPAPATNDSSEDTRSGGSVPWNQREWWEQPRWRHNRKGRQRGSWTMTGQIMAVRDPTSPSPTWAIPCRCGMPFCDGVRYVSESSVEDVRARFIYAHPDDPGAKAALEKFLDWLVDSAIKEATRNLS